MWSSPNSSAPDRLLPPDLAVRVEGLGKCYRHYARTLDRLRQLLGAGLKRCHQEIWALRNVNLEVPRGQTVGIIGANGSGKSTLLQLIAGTLTPTEGRIWIRGRVAALLELGSGFHAEFTGRENVYLNGAILGLSRQEIDSRFDTIASFADIGPAIDYPLKTYSSGMIVRLAFSVAVSVDPDVLLVDEALAVGDFRFQQRCLARLRQLRDRGVTILFVSHDLEAGKRLCDQMHVLERGRLVRSGAPDGVANWYLGHVAESGDCRLKVADCRLEERSTSISNHQSAIDFRPFRHGDGLGRITRVELRHRHGQPVKAAVMDDAYTLRFELEFHTAVETPVLGFYLRDRLGTDLIGVNTHQEQRPLPAVQAGDRLVVDFTLPLRLRPGHYSISPGLAYCQEEMRYLDWVDNALVFEVIDPEPGRVVFGLVHPEVSISIHQAGKTDAEPAIA